MKTSSQILHLLSGLQLVLLISFSGCSKDLRQLLHAIVGFHELCRMLILHLAGPKDYQGQASPFCSLYGSSI
jgi:hypothetical protein